MTPDQVRRNVVRGTLSGYLRLGIRLSLGLVIFRLLFQFLTPEQFGFWSLLWAVFGYGIVLDFGFGFAAQKRVAELSLRRDWHELSQVLSTILVFYALTAAAAASLGLVLAGPLVDLFRVSPENRESFRLVLQVFVLGTCAAFPLAVFPEILQGQQRTATANHLATVALLANFASVLAVVTWHLSLLTLALLALLSTLLPHVAAARLALRALPEVRLHPRLASRRAWLDTTRFSLYAYFNQVGVVLRNKADQPIIGGVLGAAAVAPFQAGSKVGEMFGLVSRLIADVLSPAAAHLHAQGDRAGLRRMLLHGLRFSILAATPLFVLTCAYMDAVLRLLTGMRQPGPDMYWSGQLLLLWYYSLSITHWVFKRMFLMAGQERRVMWLGLGEAALNLALSLTLTLQFRSILGVAVGSLVPTLLVGWGVLWGWVAVETGLSRLALVRRFLLPAWLGCLPMAALAVGLRTQPWWSSAATPLRFAGEIALVGGVGLLGLWRLSLDRTERHRLRAWARERIARR